MEETDEQIARNLQAQFDEEENNSNFFLKTDADLAGKKSLHQISDSESDENVDANVVPEVNSTDFTHKKINENISKNIPACQYGSKCYRKNPIHFQEYSHPNSAETFSIDDRTSEPLRKKPKLSMEPKRSKMVGDKCDATITSKSIRPFRERIEASHPYNLFLNKIYSVPETKLDTLTLVFPDLLHPHMGNLIESLQMNFMVDLDFVNNFYAACGVADKPVLIMYGQLEGSQKSFPKATLVPVDMPFLFGVHHSKIMVLQYKEGLRIVIHTANLKPDDWYEKTQGYWISPLFPPLSKGKSSLLDGESTTCFKKDFVDYILSYKSADLTRWSHIVKSYDFSACTAIFVGSVPGYHKGEKMIQFGHPKVRHCLKKYSNWQSGTASPVIAQCSSIGSLGKDAKSWLTGELGVSLSGGSEASKSTVNIIYPSEDNVRNSSQGYGGGSCLPYNSETHSKQEWIMQHFHYWSSKCRRRSASMPHIKSYTRIRDGKLQYFILSSANLSKAAWGQFQKQGSQLFIRSYEAGVLLLPKYLTSEDYFDYMDDGLPMHYDIPLNPYQQGSRPWFMNTEKKSPDKFGQYYP